VRLVRQWSLAFRHPRMMQIERQARSQRRKEIQSGRKKPGILIVGTGRCGTTLLASMLDSHRVIAVTPETHFLPEAVLRMQEASDIGGMVEILYRFPRVKELGVTPEAVVQRSMEAVWQCPSSVVVALYESYAAQEGKRRWGDNTPSYGTAIRLLDRLLGGAAFIHIIRDGRDVALSVMGLSWGPNNIADAAEWWCRGIRRIRKESRRVSLYLELRYEDLIRRPQETLHTVCRFIDEPFDAAMLDFQAGGQARLSRMSLSLDQHDAQRRQDSVAAIAAPLDPSRVQRWRTEMSAEDQQRFLRIAGSVLTDLYPDP